MKSVFRLLLLLWFVPLLAAGSHHLQVVIYGQDNLSVEDAVVELLPSAAKSSAKSGNIGHEMIQNNRTFVPFVMAVPARTNVRFPNRDKTRHQVHSFSPAKSFQLKQVAGTPRDPVTFEGPGIVALDRNFHKCMPAFIYIGESSRVAVTDLSGKATFAAQPARFGGYWQARG